MAKFKYWQQRNGQKILIKDMTNSHLENTINMLERVYSKRCHNNALAAMDYACSTSADMASYAAEGEAECLFEESESLDRIEENFPIYRDLLAELNNRSKIVKK